MDELIDFLKREDVKQFIAENVETDVNRLILNPPTNFKERIKDIASQILSRQKAKGKLEDWANNFDLIMPPPLSIEQASSKVTCEYKKLLVSGNHLVDLTGGMGVDFLALSDSFAQSTYVEKDPKLCSIFTHNAEVLGRNAKILTEEASDFLAKLDSSEKHIFFVDPARRDQNKSKVFKIEECSPNIVELLPLLQGKAIKVLVKYSPLLDIQSIVKALPAIREIHIVSVKNECKELLILIDFDFEGDAEIRCMNLGSGHNPYSFYLDDEKVLKIELKYLDKYLFEPNSSIMKAGSFKKIANDFEIDKLAEHTHLYTKHVPVKGFPGRTFRVVDEADKKNIKQYARDGVINVITRNYPISASELKKKWKLRDGGKFFLIAFRDKDEKPRMVIADRFDPLI
ncbi:hypothetical protein [Ekhidna sp.]|uniref:class I SAM-dependent methyltransferase n=1 Tax=Ekhidna sp. TaxID=2608089 RepID=UPI0032996A52